ncbi:glutamate synthase subunit beta [Staphylococcus agnetis]|uniref:glutamate synthase subunit beta n=1 Tax=Staphylococcus agnetis TaxID=985762 RepID=UPI0004E30192|nr:glutamate synthase subunit beta [Staphylococcus agnetis]KFE42412.1 glutamate synthase subunit beta [Staphylococcus agnetis]NJH65297.1 glutamate synthase small subunit [Staphylococcus agnetis]PTH46876.1 glutamate synthase subunit beta [Staphylococcus agnetis]PTH71818.1 glutamate synthase subunit beta [Staphylococcus agnetis]PTH73222.1 glutamate synthase subunit beta [Staphylococcus agnetis]
MGEFKGFMKYPKRKLDELPLTDRIANFEPYQSRFTNGDAQQQGARCMDCGTPFCQTGVQIERETLGCPLGNYIPEWNDLVYRGDFKTAYERLSETNNFPDFTGYVCPAPCEASCVMKINRDAVAIKGIERTIIDEAFENDWVKPRVPHARIDQKVAIIGSGPAGLAAAEELNALGYSVDIFEKQAQPGGLLTYGIPNMKLGKDVVFRRIDLMKAAGIRFHCNVEVGKDLTKSELDRTYDAVVVCTGAEKPRDLPLEGRMGLGIHFAMDYLTEQTQLLLGETSQQTISAKGKNVVVIGDGDTGADCVATALRDGCKSVVQFNRKAKKPERFEMNYSWPFPEPVLKKDYAHQEYEAKFGVEPRAYGIQTMRFDIDDMFHVRGIYAQVQRDQADGSLVGDDREILIPADLVLLAIGFEGVTSQITQALDLKVNRQKIVANTQDYKTNQAKYFAAGDARRGQSLVVWAIKEGREVAVSVHEHLKRKTFV